MVYYNPAQLTRVTRDDPDNTASPRRRPYPTIGLVLDVLRYNPYLPNKIRTVLDYGCGRRSYDVRQLRRLVPDVIIHGLELPPNKWKNNFLLEELPYPSYDMVYLQNVLHYQPERMVKEVLREAAALCNYILICNFSARYSVGSEKKLSLTRGTLMETFSTVHQVLSQEGRPLQTTNLFIALRGG